MTRHRATVALHYGRDDFADQERLVRTLSRERGKDMVSDYARSQPIQLELRLEENSTKKPRLAIASPEDRLPVAVARHARIVRDMRFAQSVGESYTPQQRAELAASRNALDAIRPSARIDLETAMSVDQKLIREAADGRTDRAIQAMTFEGRLRVEPQLRADTFVQRWQALDRQRRQLLGDHETSRAQRVGGTMVGMAKSLARDPQMESILRNRRTALGLPVSGRSAGHSLAELAGRWRSRGLEIGM